MALAVNEAVAVVVVFIYHFGTVFGFEYHLFAVFVELVGGEPVNGHENGISTISDGGKTVVKSGCSSEYFCPLCRYSTRVSCVLFST